jgi:tRNA (guanine37-N1)-methyltransferase
MKQEKIEEKVREVFEKQGFDVEKKGEKFSADKDCEELELKVFSSDKYSAQEVLEEVSESQKVFVDEDLEEVQEELEDVSVIREEEEEKEYELPSYELIGNIAVINELTVDEDEALEGILAHHPSVKTILVKDEPLSGEFRVGDYRKIYGEETETIHIEFGVEMRVDPTEVYFSERFSTERKRVVDQIKEGEKVLLMFAGVGPFALMAAKHSPAGKIVAIEKNPAGARYLEENIELNGIEEKVKAYQGDVREVLPLEEKFDRIIMPLPEKADEFLELAIENLEKGGVIHYYRFLEEENWGEIEEEIREAAKKLGRDYEILDRVNCGERGPSMERVCLDIRVSSEA